MATYKDPISRFAPLEVIERMLEIREELGFSQSLYMPTSIELADFLDAYGFDIYVFSGKDQKINYNDYRAPIVPLGDTVHCSITAH
jgi:hypothetical protein